MTDYDYSDDGQIQGDSEQYVTLYLADQMFGIPVLQVHDILGPQRVTHVPLAQEAVMGSLNLRGRIVTAIDARIAIGLQPLPPEERRMNVVVEHEGELYSLVVDRVGEVLSVPSKNYERSPGTLDPRFRQVAAGIYRLEHSLLVVLDVTKLLRIDLAEAV
jgi:purine-binding chemotaxis protein CheW